MAIAFNKLSTALSPANIVTDFKQWPIDITSPGHKCDDMVALCHFIRRTGNGKLLINGQFVEKSSGDTATIRISRSLVRESLSPGQTGRPESEETIEISGKAVPIQALPPMIANKVSPHDECTIEVTESDVIATFFPEMVQQAPDQPNHSPADE